MDTKLISFLESLSSPAPSVESMEIATLFQESFNTGKKIVLTEEEAMLISNHLDVLREKIEFIDSHCIIENVESELHNEGLARQLGGAFVDSITFKALRLALTPGMTSVDVNKLTGAINAVNKEFQEYASDLLKSKDIKPSDKIPESAVNSMFANLSSMQASKFIIADDKLYAQIIKDPESAPMVGNPFATGSMKKYIKTYGDVAKYMDMLCKRAIEYVKVCDRKASSGNAVAIRKFISPNAVNAWFSHLKSILRRAV